ncbi:HmuY family protein [Acinetobacter sp. TR11]|uniref:HmuY family protein n=1 Tax=Acinetobacter sp. TR11 TaxID=3003393 RepID=UPI0022AC638E|nr:HmuY family protein [Acinetobacter sp. TR11]WAU72334.1 HmuY family protein [Acinetobacter sp. TR11]
MSHLNLAKLFALSTLSTLLIACGGGGSSDNGGNSTPPATKTDLFTLKSKQWRVTPSANNSYCYDIDTQTEISCTTAEWDLKFAMGTRTPLLFSNSGVSGSGNGGVLYSPFDATWENLSKELDATQSGSLPAQAWSVDAYSNAFMDTTSGSNSFFEYDLFGDHRMSPNFKTFLVTTDSSSKNVVGTYEKPVFAVQIYNYYQGTTSGYISIRYINTQLPHDVKTLTIDATQGWNYVDLSTGTTTKGANAKWQLAFNRYNVQLNQGIGSMVTSQPAGFYGADGKPVIDKFKDSNAYVTTEADLKAAVSTTNVKWGSNSITSILNPAFKGTYPQKLSYGWYNYYPTLAAAQADGLQAAHMLKANTDSATVIRGNKGNSYARLHLKEVKYADPSNASSATTWTFELDVQPAK